MDDLMIRRARETDMVAIEELICELIEAMHETRTIDKQQAAQNIRRLFGAKNSYFLVAEKNGVVGFINFTTRQTILHSGPSGNIDELVVRQTDRGTGVGRALLEVVIAECRQLGCAEVEATTEFDNARARRFYQSCGFDEIGVLLEMDLG